MYDLLPPRQRCKCRNLLQIPKQRWHSCRRSPIAVYDVVSRTIAVINADGGIITTSYDPANNITLLLDPRNQGATLTYDAANRLLTEQYTDGNRFTYTYDPVGNRRLV